MFLFASWPPPPTQPTIFVKIIRMGKRESELFAQHAHNLDQYGVGDPDVVPEPEYANHHGCVIAISC